MSPAQIFRSVPPGGLPYRPGAEDFGAGPESGLAPGLMPGAEPPRPSRQRLWLALHFPDLLPVSAGDETAPTADPAALEALAGLAARYTPDVSPEPPAALLLEVRGSLRLFGGLDRLKGLLLEACRARGHGPVLAAAPTARAALWLARAGRELTVRRMAALPSILAGVPIGVLGWPPRDLALLAELGITTLGECLRLPREGLARRLGPARLRDLDEACGRHPEVRPVQAPPPRFRAERELPFETADASLVLEGCRALVVELDACLVSRQASIRGMGLRLVHPGGGDTRLAIGVGHPSAGRELLLDLVRLRLGALRLSTPVTALVLEAGLIPGRTPAGVDLLGRDASPGAGFPILVERLRARLGRPAVHGLSLVADHRPERAWRAVPDPAASSPAHPPVMPAADDRPLWILPRPRFLGAGAGQVPSGIRMERGPERIETGWWDGDDVRRDYYVARDARGTRLWVFVDLRQSRWYLHGIFG